MTEVKRTERGWAGHFICSDRCLFRRNTLLEYGDRKLVVSTVGNMVSSDREITTIGADRWYETMVFEATNQGGYFDADTRKQIYPDQELGIWGKSWEEVMEKYPLVDNVANDMHERIVAEMTEKIQTGEYEHD